MHYVGTDDEQQQKDQRYRARISSWISSLNVLFLQVDSVEKHPFSMFGLRRY